MTALPLASCSGPALCDPIAAAAHRVVVRCSRAVSALLVPVASPPPGPRPPNALPIALATGPDDGMLPVWGRRAVSTAYAEDPARPAKTATATTATNPLRSHGP